MINYIKYYAEWVLLLLFQEKNLESFVIKTAYERITKCFPGLGLAPWISLFLCKHATRQQMSLEIIVQPI